MRRLLVVALGLGAGLAGYFLWPKSANTPEQEVRALVERCVAAAEKRDLGPIAEVMADDFTGPEGTSRQDVKQVLLGHFMRSPAGLVVVNPSLEVTVESPAAATFKGTFVFARGKTPELLNEGGLARYEIEGRVEKRDDGWMIVRASWQR